LQGFVNYKNGCTRLAAASNKVYQLLAHGRWFSPASSITKTGRHDIAEILLKVALKHQKIKSKSNPPFTASGIFKVFVLEMRKDVYYHLAI
jgi:signal recognition particle subunit SEC65